MNEANRSFMEIVLAEARSVALETGGERAARAVGESASLERDVGLGSLERVELITRIERRTGRSLPEDALQAETCAEIAAALASTPLPRAREERGPAEPAAPGALVPTGPQHLAATVDRALAQRAERGPDRVTIFLIEEDGSERAST